MTPYYDHDGITLYCGEERDIVPKMERVDLVVTDPPYGETSLEWDVWPVGWPCRASKKACQMWCFGSMRMFLEQSRQLSHWKFAQDIVWEKHNGSGLAADRFRRVHEHALHFYIGEWSALYLKALVVTIKEDRVRQPIKRGSKPQHFGGIEEGSPYEFNGQRLQRSVFTVRSCHRYAVNETQKPEAVIAPLINYSIPKPGGVVLDPFAGSGTVLAVARSQGRRAIGIEKRESQCAEIVKRLAQRDLGLQPK